MIFIHNSLLVCTKYLQYMTIVIVLTLMICHDSSSVMSQNVTIAHFYLTNIFYPLIGVPDIVDSEKIQTVAGISSITITWEAQAVAGCADNITYQGEVYLLDKNNTLMSITSFNTTANTFTIENLYPNSWYLILLCAANELGVSKYSNVSVKTNETGSQAAK